MGHPRSLVLPVSTRKERRWIACSFEAHPIGDPECSRCTGECPGMGDLLAATDS
jgi:hypothetical protein